MRLFVLAVGITALVGCGSLSGQGASSDAGTPDAGARGRCNTDEDCVFRASEGCCGACLNLRDTPVGPAVCTADCIAPPGGCSCVDHMCARGILNQGDPCNQQLDACGSGVKCCRKCTVPNCTAPPVCTSVPLTNGVLTCPAFL